MDRHVKVGRFCDGIQEEEMIEDFTIDNDVSSSGVGQPCGLYRYSPKAINENFVEEVLGLAKNEPELPIELREMISNSSNQDVDFLIEWCSNVLTSALAEKRRRYVFHGLEFQARHGE